MRPSLIAAQALTKSFGDVAVLRGIDLTVREGEVVSIVGPSGAGKSTLLRCLNRLDVPSGGQVLLDGVEVGNERRELVRLRRAVGMVFQNFNLFPHMTALANVMEGPLIALKMPRTQAEELARSLLDRVGLADKMSVRPAHLSGGQQQRVAIARALAMRPRIMLFDEPTSALDPELTAEVLGVMRRLAQEGMTMIVVSHEMAFVRRVAHRVIFMDEGVVQEEASPDCFFESPGTERAHRFLAIFRDMM
jgi:ABC-type polar amino acid transport system ATPase subunit